MYECDRVDGTYKISLIKALVIFVCIEGPIDRSQNKREEHVYTG